MTEAEKRTVLEQRKETSLKNTLFNRYLLLRYTLALFFFSNLYWFLISLSSSLILALLPLSMIVLSSIASIEQFKLYDCSEPILVQTGRFVRLQIIVQVSLFFISWTPFFTFVFPAFAENLTARLFISMMLVAGLGILSLNYKRLKAISANEDKAYLRYLKMKEQVLNV
ncbi:hypothetical protein STRDD10_01408 [Streptococcus sp. DD10]|uniref:hypothetical protein n=1 Tax=Streptococcus sp. DD10 TaxID=1777878 RepID=UPI000794B0A0|nr:hypothetical protein [Streptococcus sp. DD10]KXT73665.1 hypothetical protein STRDD10_01408 [Streptococcus sp. DD10]